MSKKECEDSCIYNRKKHAFQSGCWANDPHERPSFKEIQQELDKIVRSGFTETPNESFHTMQDGWKKEIAEVLQELRIKEKVRTNTLH